MTSTMYRVGDTLPRLQILVRDGAQVIPLAGTGVKVRWQRPDGSLIAERDATIDDAPNGVASYPWQSGDLTVPGVYSAIIQLDRSGQRYSLAQPPLVQIEVLSNAFTAPDTALALIPQVPGYAFAALIGEPLATLDAAKVVFTLDRGRYVAYTYSELWRCPGISLSPVDQRIAQELVLALAARDWYQPPSVIYGAYKMEQIGSYKYELRDPVEVNPAKGVLGPTGDEGLDSLIGYLRQLCRAGGSVGLDVMFPDYRQPIVDRIMNPLWPTSGIGPAAPFEPYYTPRAQDTW